MGLSEQGELDELQKLLTGGNSNRRTPPTHAEIVAMPVHAAVRTLEQFGEIPRIVEAVCDRWRGLSYGPGRRQSAADAGALSALVKVMQIHSELPSVQGVCCLSIGNIVAGMDEAGVVRKQLAADAGALEAVANAMQVHAEDSTVIEYGCFAMGNICFAADAAGLARKQRAADACAISAILGGMRAHSGEGSVQEYGCFALGNICRAVGGKDGGTDDEGKQRKEAAVDAGALSTIVNAMRFYAKEDGVQQWGSRALSNITYGNPAWRDEARKAGARPQWLVGVADGLDAIEAGDKLDSSKTERVAIRAPQQRVSATTRSPMKRAPKLAPKIPTQGAGKMIKLPDAGPLWR